MLNWMNASKIQPMGLDIGHSAIKMIQLCCENQTVRVVAAREAEIDPALSRDPAARRDFIVSSIRQMQNQGAFVGRRVISCLPGDVIKIKSLRLDTDDPAEIEQFMRTEVAGRFGLKPDVDELRYMVAGSVFQGEQMKNEVLFFGVQREALADHLAMLEEAHLEPMSLDTVPFALFRSFQMSLRRREDKDMVSVLVDLGSHFTTVIIGKGRQILFIKQIPIAGEHLTEEVAARLGIRTEEAGLLRTKLRSSEQTDLDAETIHTVSDAMNNGIETLSREIALCFKYYAVTFRGQRPAEAVFAGGEAYESTLMNALRRHLGLQIRIAEPLRGFDLKQAGLDRRTNPQMCEWAVAVGLALRELEVPDNTDEQDEVLQETV
ncbi:MAG: pilus assembly protein PilM [Anaerohalosphaeraceae bacterium]